MTVRRSGDASGLADLIRSLASKAPQAVVTGLQESAMLLQAQVQSTIAHSDPIPVDVGQYKATWGKHNTPDGAQVGNTSKQATFVERGRRKGKAPPADALVPWVVRHWRDFDLKKKAAAFRKQNKGMAKATAKMIVAKKIAIGLAIAIGKRGIKARWVLRRALTSVKRKIPAILRRHVQQVSP